MADNYLEKQYADYEKRRAEWERQKRLGKVKTKKSGCRVRHQLFLYLIYKIILGMIIEYPQQLQNQSHLQH